MAPFEYGKGNMALIKGNMGLMKSSMALKNDIMAHHHVRNDKMKHWLAHMQSNKTTTSHVSILHVHIILVIHSKYV